MIDLNIQFKLIIFSFSFGFLFSPFLDWFNKKTINIKSSLKIVLSFVILILATFIYFIGLQKIGYGLFHTYEILSIITGFIAYDVVNKFIAK